MNRLVEEIKKFLNKDITHVLSKYKIPVVGALVVVLLVCVGFIVTYAFYQTVDTTPIIGGSTGKIADLEVRVMAEERDANGIGLGKYGLYPYIPKAGYRYNESKSYCTNGSGINYDASSYEATITASGHDVCYLYFDSTASLDLTLNVFAENVDSDGNGTGEYTQLETTALPSIGYELNSSKSSCQNGSSLSYSNKDNLFTIEATEKDVCNAYMDAMNVDIALKLYVQAKSGSKEYYEAKTIPTTSYYDLNTTKSACTGTSNLSLTNQKVVISATSRTNCVAYLDVSSGPILQSMSANSDAGILTLSAEDSNVGTSPKTYYFSSDGGNSYQASNTNSYTFDNEQSGDAKAYYEDASGKTSAILTLPKDENYVYNGLFPYKNSAQKKVIEVSGYYYLQVWGAQGGYRTDPTKGGLGGYSYGYIYLNEGDTLFIHTGGEGGSGANGCGQVTCPGGYNGGGYRSKYYGGGGATDIRINNDDLLARVIVAGGGGSDGAADKMGMHGGGLAGGSTSEASSLIPNYGGKGGTQTYSGNSLEYTAASQATSGLNSNNKDLYGGGFGFGGGGIALNNGFGGAGGGGWYGGSGNVPDEKEDNDRGGGGGSGYIYTSATANLYPEGCLLNDGYYLSNAATIAGNTSFESVTGLSEVGHSGNGYAKVTYIGDTLS